MYRNCICSHHITTNRQEPCNSAVRYLPAVKNHCYTVCNRHAITTGMPDIKSAH